MLRLPLALAIVAALAGAEARAQTAAQTAAQTPAPVDHAKVETFVDGAVREAMRADKIAGVSVAIVDRAGVVMTRGYGAAAFEPYRKVDADTLFRVGSISKTPVWIAIMQLVEGGKLGLDDPINDHLPPELRIPDEGFQKPIRVRDLMTHAAGFEDSIEGLFVHDPTNLLPLDQQPRRPSRPSGARAGDARRLFQLRRGARRRAGRQCRGRGVAGLRRTAHPASARHGDGDLSRALS